MMFLVILAKVFRPCKSAITEHCSIYVSRSAGFQFMEFLDARSSQGCLKCIKNEFMIPYSMSFHAIGKAEKNLAIKLRHNKNDQMFVVMLGFCMSLFQ